MKKMRSFLIYAGVFLVGIILIQFLFGDTKENAPIPQEISGNQFTKYLNTQKIKEINVISLGDDKKYDITLEDSNKVFLYRTPALFVADKEVFEKNNIIYKEVVSQKSEGKSLGATFLSIILQVLFFVGIFFIIGFILNRNGKNQQNNMFNGMNKKFQVLDFTSSTSKDSKTYKTTLDDVIGIPKTTRQSLENLASTMNKMVNNQVIGTVNLTGVLLYGPPGTGKSMIAKALAVNTKSFFIHVSGSDFVDKFVGQGANNVNNLFNSARKVSMENDKAPVVIFIDEIDSIGKKRDGGGSAANDEREATLNAILHHLSGVESDANVFVIGATNFKESLDDALLRSGRLSTHIEIPRPTKEGRKLLFDYYLKKLPKVITLTDNVDRSILAEYAVNMTGADIAEIVEAIQKKANGVESQTVFDLNDMIELIETVTYGTIREELMEDDKVMRDTAYHEAGHALLALKYFPNNVLKACVTPRHKALGYVFHNIMDNKVSLFKKESKHYIQVTLGGLIAEKLTFDDTSSGVKNDLEQANGLAKNLIQKYGAGDSLLIKPDETFKEGISEYTMARQEDEMGKILEECRESAEMFLNKNKVLLIKFAELLLDKKMLNKNDIAEFYNEHKSYFEEEQQVLELQKLPS